MATSRREEATSLGSSGMARSTAMASNSISAVAIMVLAAVMLVAPALSLPPPLLLLQRERDIHAAASAACPPQQVDSIVRSAVQAALQREVALAAGLLRIFFHDCFPQGCDASVLLKGAGTEQDMGPNTTLQPRALQLIEDIRGKVHAACGATVSCADITALATRAAVVASGGPSYDVALGNLDSLAPASQDVVFNLPSPATASVAELQGAFAGRGLRELADLVALSGGHTVGRAGCGSFADRSGRMDDTFSKKLAVNCSKDPKRVQNLDVRTPDLFDNAYFVDLTFNQGVFTSDMALIKDRAAARIVKQFAASKDDFFRQFAASMAKLSRAPRPAGNVGEIRRQSCFRRNGNGNGQSIIEELLDVQGFAASA